MEKKDTFTYHQIESMELSRALNEETSWKNLIATRYIENKRDRGSSAYRKLNVFVTMKF